MTRWFAWYPVRVQHPTGRQWAWMRYVMRSEKRYWFHDTGVCSYRIYEECAKEQQ